MEVPHFGAKTFELKKYTISRDNVPNNRAFQNAVLKYNGLQISMNPTDIA